MFIFQFVSLEWPTMKKIYLKNKIYLVWSSCTNIAINITLVHNFVYLLIPNIKIYLEYFINHQGDPLRLAIGHIYKVSHNWRVHKPISVSHRLFSTRNKWFITYRVPYSYQTLVFVLSYFLNNLNLVFLYLQKNNFNKKILKCLESYVFFCVTLVSFFLLIGSWTLQLLRHRVSNKMVPWKKLRDS